jgi:cytoskeletal protein CcmA (bactofilin family)
MRPSQKSEKDDKAWPAERRDPPLLAVISESAVLNGYLHSTASIRLNGLFKGTIIADHELIIAPQGRVEARVMARRAVIAGVFQGEMVVLEELEITPTGRFFGKLIQKEPALRIDLGGRFEAQSVFVDDLEAVIAPWMAPPQPDTDLDKHIALDEIKL